MPSKYTAAMPRSAPGMASSAVTRSVACRPGIAPPLTIRPNTTAPISAPTNAPTMPPQNRSGSQIVKCHRARPIMTQASMPISRPSVPSSIPPVTAAALGLARALRLGLRLLARRRPAAGGAGGRGAPPRARAVAPRRDGLGLGLAVRRPVAGLLGDVGDHVVELLGRDLLRLLGGGHS